MNTQKPYLNQYYETELEWLKNGINIENAGKEQVEKMFCLRQKAIEQSGLSPLELSLICSYRLHKIFNNTH